MAKCKVCGEPVTGGVVMHAECLNAVIRSKWISISCLPETPHHGQSEEEDYEWMYSDEVLIFSSYGNQDIFIGILVLDKDGGGWLDRNGSYIKGVTHWMPLPVPPIRKEKA